MAWANFQRSGFVCFDITCLPLKNVSIGILFIFRCLVVFLRMLQKIVSDICLVQKIINISTSSPLLESIHILEFSSKYQLQLKHPLGCHKFCTQRWISHKNKNKWEREREGSCGGGGDSGMGGMMVVHCGGWRWVYKLGIKNNENNF